MVRKGCLCIHARELIHQLFILMTTAKPEAVYFSLGDRETKVSNPALRVTEDVMKKLSENCRNRGVASLYEQNPGNHYTDCVNRVVKGIDWVLRTLN